MPRVSESERLEIGHSLWVLAARRAAGEISRVEYETGFWAQLRELGEVFDLGAMVAATPAAAGRRQDMPEASVCLF